MSNDNYVNMYEIDDDDPLCLLEIEDNIKESLKILEEKNFDELDFDCIPINQDFNDIDQLNPEMQQITFISNHLRSSKIKENEEMKEMIRKFLRNSKEKTTPLRRNRDLNNLLK